MPPFRQPASQEDDDSWTPPDYAKPVSDSSDNWKPPDYAKAVKEEPKGSEFKARASKALGEFVSDVKSIPHSLNEGVKGVVSKALDTPIIGRILKSQDPGSESVLPRSESLTKEPETYWGGFAKGLYENWARPLASATGVAGLLSGGEGESLEKTPERPLAVRSPRPLDYVNKSGEKSAIKQPVSTPQSNLAEYMKKNPDAKMADVEEFIKSTQVAKTPAKQVPVTRITDKGLGFSSDKENTWAVHGHLDDVEAAKLNDMYKSGKGDIHRGYIPESDVDLSKNMSDEFGNTIINPKSTAKFTPLAEAELPKGLEEYDKKQGMAQPLSDEELTKTKPPVAKQKTFNPFDKVKTAEASPEFETKPVEESQVRQPTARFAHYDPLLEANQYNIEGGELDRSTKGQKFIDDNNIPISEGPSNKPRVLPNKLDELRAKASEKSGEAWKPPDYFKPEERTSEEELTKGFGGSGHPESPDYVSKVLSDAGKGDAGLKIEDKEGFKHIVYRNQSGEPIAAAKIVTGPDGKNMIQDIAADKSKGLLTGRAMKAIGDKLNELGATESSGTTSSDAQNFLAKMKDRMSKAADIKVESPEPVGIGARIKGFLKDEEGSARLPDEEDDITDLHGGLGAIGSQANKQPSTGPHAAVLDKLFNSLEESKGLTDVQSQMYKKERAKRFAAYSDQSISGGGVSGAAKRLSTLKGQYEKIEPLYGKLQLDEKETASLFDAVDKANISTPEKARGTVALFKLMNGESVPQRNELALLDEVFGNGFASRITEMHGGLGATGIKIAKAANTMKSMENAVSLAAPLRHGAGLMYRKEFTPAFADMFRFFGNKEYYNAAMDALEKRPDYLLGRESGLFFAKQGSMLDSEEQFLNSYVGDLPKLTGIPQTVAASQRGYVGFLNKLRSDVFDGMLKTMKSLGNETHTMVGDQMVPSKGVEAIAKFINNATGRGELLGNMNKLTNELNIFLWSPRMISSRINMLANPKIYMDLPKGMRLEGLKSLLGIASMSLVVNGLGILGGATVGTNILSTDFMKSRFKGGKVIDPNAGVQQYIVAAARFLAGKTDSKTPTSRLEIAGRFLANKESPLVSLAHTLLTAKKFTGKSDDPATAGNFTTQYGEKTSIQSEIGKRFTPIFIQDIKDLIKNDPDFSDNIGLNTAMAGASLAGMEQQYSERKPKSGLGSLRLR